MLSVECVTKKYGDFTALREIDLTFEKGVYGLLAPNGAGKTTLLKLLATLLFPTQGRILWQGEDILALGEEYRGILGYLPQEFGYYKNYSPRQFLRYVAALQKLDRKKAESRIEELLGLLGLREVKDQKMRRFSGGMAQRVGIAQAMLTDPQLLILDEPTAGLDPKERVRFRNLIHSLAQDRIVLLSTHIVSDVETIADKIVMLKEGRVHCCAAPAQITAPMKGRLFELPAGGPLPQGCRLLSERQGEEGPLYRFAALTPPAGARPAAPTLEDAFLYIYGDETP